MQTENDLINQHKQQLSVTRELISQLIGRLEEIASRGDLEEDMSAEWKYIWGDKENVVSSLIKLTVLLIKIIPVEQDLNSNSSSIDGSSEEKNMTEDDKEIIRGYIERIRAGEV